MTFFKGLLKKFKGGDDPKRKSSINGITRDINPEDQWEVVNELGDGAFGKVFKAVKKNSSIQAALKKVEFDSEIDLEDLMVEIDILTNFKHPNVLSLLEMYLELCGGGAIDSIMNTLDQPLNEPQIRFVSHEVLMGLAFLHENLIIHRDMKAGNVLLTLSGEVKLADFGVSAHLANEKQKRDTFIGTPYWMAPEVIACETFKESPYNWKADVWSFGITVIEFAEMRPPYNEINPTRVLLKITKSDPPKLKKPNLWSAEMQEFLARCLLKDPVQRPECKDLLMQPFVRDVCEADRQCIRLLLCELKADVIDTVEDLDPADLPEVEQEESVLVLPDSTKIVIPVEVMEEDDDAEIDSKDQSVDNKDTGRDSGLESDMRPAIPVTEEDKSSDPGSREPIVLSSPGHVLLTEVTWFTPSSQSSTSNRGNPIRFQTPIKRSVSCKPSLSPKPLPPQPVTTKDRPPTDSVRYMNLKRRVTISHAPPRSGRLVVPSASSKRPEQNQNINTNSVKWTDSPSAAESHRSVLRQSSCRVLSSQSPVVIRLNRSKTIRNVCHRPETSPVRCRTELIVPFSPTMTPRVSQLRRRLCNQATNGSGSPQVRQLLAPFVAEIAEQIIDEVLNSETEQPSAPFCVFEVMRDLNYELQQEGLLPTEEQAPPETESYQPQSTDECPSETQKRASISSKATSPVPVTSSVKEKNHHEDIVSVGPSRKSTEVGSDSMISLSKSSGLSRKNSAYRTLTRTRRFVIDGKEMTTTSKHIIRLDEQDRKHKEEELNKRKAELRAFRLLQKQETRQMRELTILANQRQEFLETKLSAEFMRSKEKD
ncbi:unnamed protein product [Echinostoma caproni]|uniref:Protein kinase domain-containing protein n=1 Tax=Echinostoma caproni TaxID=27848 RepID=A0A183AHU9_9TREM|nr:unnamed protein product [Echinostoma caproni]